MSRAVLGQAKLLFRLFAPISFCECCGQEYFQVTLAALICFRGENQTFARKSDVRKKKWWNGPLWAPLFC
jgi:hypothetical protein